MLFLFEGAGNPRDSDTRMLAKFVRRKDSALLIDFAVSAVHTKRGVPVRVDPPVIKIDLKKY